MALLTLVTAIWAFSFGLFGKYLAGIDPFLTAFIRLAVALPVFLPFLRMRTIPTRCAVALAVIGAIQYGLMYCALNAAYGYVPSHIVVLFTTTTPLFIGLLVAARFRARRGRSILFVAAFLAVSGAVLLQLAEGDLQGSNVLAGFAVMQVSNLCFAWGQLAYVRRMRELVGIPGHSVYALLFAGAVAVTAVATTLSGGWADVAGISSESWLALIYLGLVASGLGFFLWNTGARQTSAGVLAVFNNMKIPAGIAVSILVFGETVAPFALALGGALMVAGLLVGQRYRADVE